MNHDEITLSKALAYARWTSVQSSNIKRCLYFRKTSLLVIEFHHESAVYMFHPVPWGLYLKFRHAKSQGGYFAAYIRDSLEIQSQRLY